MICFNLEVVVPAFAASALSDVIYIATVGSSTFKIRVKNVFLWLYVVAIEAFPGILVCGSAQTQEDGENHAFSCGTKTNFDALNASLSFLLTANSAWSFAKLTVDLAWLFRRLRFLCWQDIGEKANRRLLQRQQQAHFRRDAPL